MQVRMMQQFGPQVWSTAKKPISAPRCLGSAAMVRQGFGRGAEENAVDHVLVLIGDRGNLFRHGEDDVEVLAVEKFGLAVFDPFARGPATDILGSADRGSDR